MMFLSMHYSMLLSTDCAAVDVRVRGRGRWIHVYPMSAHRHLDMGQRGRCADRARGSWGGAGGRNSGVQNTGTL